MYIYMKILKKNKINTHLSTNKLIKYKNDSVFETFSVFFQKCYF